MTKLTGGYEHWIHQKLSLFVVLIIFWLLIILLRNRWLFHLFGIRMSLLRLCCSLGDYSETSCQQKTICSIVVSLITISKCVAGCGLEESSHPLFLHCNVFGSVWHLIYKWLGIVTVIPYNVSYHFNQFSYSGDMSKVRRSVIQVIWFASVWEIWKERNNRIFNDKECSVTQVVDKIKSLTFRWLKVNLFNYHGWWLSPFTILGIG